MAKISSDLEQQLKNESYKMFDLIIRTEEAVASHLAWLQEHGIEVKQQYRLVPGAAISCRGQDALALIDAAWVVSIEIDAAIRAS